MELQFKNVTKDYGNVHAVEKLRQSIEIWYATSEYLRQEMEREKPL